MKKYIVRLIQRLLDLILVKEENYTEEEFQEETNFRFRHTGLGKGKYTSHRGNEVSVKVVAGDAEDIYLQRRGHLHGPIFPIGRGEVA